jgi:hypothetical protein
MSHPYTRLYIELTAPTVTDDETTEPPHEIGDVWVDRVAGDVYVALDVSAGAAVWFNPSSGGITFDDSEGDPSVVDDSAGADGTSVFAARRDHVHELDFSAFMIAQAVLGTIDGFDKFIVRVDADGSLGTIDGEAFVNNYLSAILATYFATIGHQHSLVGEPKVDHTDLTSKGTYTHTTIDAHLASTANPHGVTAEQSGAIPTGGWEARSETWTRTGNHTFTVAGDLTAIYRKYRRVQYNDGAVDYGVILSSSHAAGTTTVTLVTNTSYTMAATTITAKYISSLSMPDGFPTSFNWSSSPTITVGSGTLVSKCMPGIDGFMDYEWSLDLNTTTMASLNFTPPATPTISGARVPVGLVTFLDASPAASYPGCVLYINGSNIFGVRAFNASGTFDTQVSISGTIPFTWANSDGLYISGRYPY